MPKALTREELQARTRELVLDAAERVFLAKGYHATSVAQIAAEAGRTQGSIYGNFASKEALCLQVLRTFYEGLLADIATTLLVTEGMSGKVQAFEAKWRAFSTQADWIGLTAEYVLAVRHVPEQAQRVRETVAALQAGVKAVLVTQLESEGVRDRGALVDDAVAALLATGVGLAISQALGTIDVDQSSAVVVDTVSMWRDRIETTPTA